MNRIDGEHPLSAISLDEIHAQIRDLDKIDKEASNKELNRKLTALLSGYTCITQRLMTRKAWRARKNEYGEVFSNISQLWCPPPEQIATYGRLNFPGQPLLYVSADHLIATLEMRPQVGDSLTVLEIELKDDSVFPKVMELGLAEKASQYGFSVHVKIPENTVIGRLALKGNEQKNMAIRSFLANQLTKIVDRGNESEFKITANISKILLSNDQVDGVLYPSIAGDGRAANGGSNLALKPESASRLFSATGCWMIDVLGHGAKDGELVVQCTRRAKSIAADGAIGW